MSGKLLRLERRAEVRKKSEGENYVGEKTEVRKKSGRELSRVNDRGQRKGLRLERSRKEGMMSGKYLVSGRRNATGGDSYG